MFDDDVDVIETKLPGIGVRHDFLTDGGRRVGVVSHRNGSRDLVVFSKDDPDSCSQVLQMSATEADALAQFLGSGRIAWAPVEDLLFGFALVLQTLAWWVFWGRRGVQRERPRVR